MGWSASSLIVQSRALSFRFTLNSGTVARPTQLNEVPEGGVALVTNAVAQRNAPTATNAATPAAALTNLFDVIVVALSGSFCILLITGWCARHKVRRNVQ